jgi:hypothetical protein
VRARDVKPLVAGGVACILFLLAGCGGSDSETVAETVPRLTKAQLGEKLGDICQEHTDRQVIAIEKFDKEHGWPYGTAHEKASEAQLEKELTVVILPIVRDNIHDLKSKVVPPRGQEAKLEEFYESLEYGIAVSERDPSWVLGKTAREPFSRARELSWELGTAYCGQA